MARFLLVLIGCLWLGRAASAAEVVVVNIGWHTGIAVRLMSLDADLLPEVLDFRRPDVAWVEFGWGDAGFYQNPDPDLSTILSAAFAETPAVMHLVGVPVHPTTYYKDSSFVTVTLTDQQLERLLGYISASFDRNGTNRVTPINKGLYPDSLFYAGRGNFTIANTCNTWVAKAFAAAGLPIETPEEIVRASEVMDRLVAAGAVRVSAAE